MPNPKSKPLGRKVFIVHGHDEELLDDVNILLLKLRLDPVILREAADEGNTIIEKLEVKASDVSLAVVLFTPDDERWIRTVRRDFLGFEETKFTQKARVRNNVLLEFGYFLGKLGRRKIIVLKAPHDSWEIPSDIDGVLYIPLDKQGKWKARLAGEIHARGITIDPGHIPT